MSAVEFHGPKFSKQLRKKVTILPVSGNIDSVYLLERLLIETDDTILAHHIHLVDQKGLHILRRERCRAIMNWCKEKYRSFEYSESAIDHRDLIDPGTEIIAAAFEVGIVGRSYTAKHNERVDRWIFSLPDDEEHDIDLDDHASKACAASSFPYPPPQLFHLSKTNRISKIRQMPDELVQLCWICQNPASFENGNIENCGSCPSCVAVTESCGMPPTKNSDALYVDAKIEELLSPAGKVF